MKYVIYLIVAFGIFIQKAQAYSCTTVTPTTTITTPNIVISRSLPVGSEIGSTSTGIISVFECQNTAPTLTYQVFGVKGIGTYETSVESKRIYKTGIQGIGYAIEGYTYNCETDIYSGWVGMGSNIDGNANNRGLCGINGMFPKQPITGMIRIAYYKTEEVTGSGTVSPGIVANFILQNNQSSWHLPESAVNLSSFAVTTIPCEVNQAVIGVSMGEVERKEFKGIGTWAGDAYTKNFNIPLSCNPDTKVNVQIEGSIQNANQGVLNIAQTDNSADGIGIQLLFNNMPLTLGTPFYIGTTASNGLYNIPLQARYYQTGNTVRPGVANATATFTLTYQ